MLAFAVLHKSAHSFNVVAFGMTQPANDSAICERAFDATNSIESVWYECAEQNGIEVLLRTRSTSVGDVVAIIDGESRRFYRCESDGWSPLNEKPAHRGVTGATRPHCQRAVFAFANRTRS